MKRLLGIGIFTLATIPSTLFLISCNNTIKHGDPETEKLYGSMVRNGLTISDKYGEITFKKSNEGKDFSLREYSAKYLGTDGNQHDLNNRFAFVIESHDKSHIAIMPLPDKDENGGWIYWTYKESLEYFNQHFSDWPETLGIKWIN